jgi:predicted nucleic acid-binding protein
MLVLADTSIWVDHLRNEDVWFGDLLEHGAVAIHPFVIGELALGNVPNFDNFIHDLRDLPQVSVVDIDAVLQLIKRDKLSGSGIGYVDAHLLASVAQMPATKLLTSDKRLHAAATRLAVAFER